GFLCPIVTFFALILLRPFVFPPYERISVPGLSIELWVSRRRFPMMALPNALIVPVAPDLKMIFGIAKIARDWGANKVQYEANQVAPLPPGEAFIGTGARFRYRNTILAVIFDDAKRTTPERMTQCLRRAMQLAAENGADSVMVP